jgi:hypothetical protein
MLQSRGVGYNYTIYEKDLCVTIEKMEWMPSPSGSIIQSHEFKQHSHEIGKELKLQETEQ